MSGHQNMAVTVESAYAQRNKGKLKNNCHNNQSPDKYLNSRPSEYEMGLLTTLITVISDVTLHMRVLQIHFLYRIYLISRGNFFSCWSMKKCGTFIASYYPVNSSLVDIQCQPHHCQQSQLMSSLSQ